jgi:hypothetical protein
VRPVSHPTLWTHKLARALLCRLRGLRKEGSCPRTLGEVFRRPQMPGPSTNAVRYRRVSADDPAESTSLGEVLKKQRAETFEKINTKVSLVTRS